MEDIFESKKLKRRLKRELRYFRPVDTVPDFIYRELKKEWKKKRRKAWSI